MATKWILRCSSLSLCLMLAALTVTSQAEIKPAAVLTQLNAIELRINKIATHMGVKPNMCLRVTISNASPREVYFQAKRLQSKVYRLHDEITQNLLLQPQKDFPKLETLQPSQVLEAVKDSNKRIVDILNHLQLTNQVNSDPANEKTTPSQVYNKLLLENQVVNQLLEKRALPADVYQVTTLSVYYAGEILNQMQVNDILLKLPAASTAAKTSRDIFEQQIEILTKIQQLGKALNLEMLSLKRNACGQPIDSNNTQELAYLILSELSYLAEKLSVKTSTIRSYYPGKKYPLDVFNRNQLLSKQVDAMIKFIHAHPDWLKKNQHGS